MPLVVRIRQHDFPIEREFVEGHIMTESEAQAMNQLLVENIRNNVTGWVTKLSGGRAALTAEQHADLTEKINDYANAYEFKTRMNRRPANPLDATIREIAWQHAETWGNQHGFERSSDEVFTKYLEFKESPDTAEEARLLVLSRQSVIDESLMGLL